MAARTASPIAIDTRDGTATVYLNRPRARNRLDASMASALAEACVVLDASDDVRVVMLTGCGVAFSDGISEGPSVRAADAVAAIRKPVIAAINGDCLDQGLELALACDVRVASGSARLGMRHVARGLLPWDGGTQRLPRTVGRAHALRLLLTSAVVTAGEAQRIGLVQEVVPGVRLVARAAAIARRVAQAAPIALAYAKEAALAGADLPLAHALRLEADLGLLLHTTHDRAEGIASFARRRSPRFEGR